MYAKCRKDIPEAHKGVSRMHHPPYPMVLAGVSSKVLSPLHFCEKGVKTNGKNYRENVHERVVKPLNNSLFNGEEWTFQQDSAPVHKARATQDWLRTEIPDFIISEEWPASSPDLNPLDYKIWVN